VQEAAHETLLRTERRIRHSYVANVLEQRMEVVERQPELLGVEPALSRVFNRHLHPRPAGADRGSAGHVMCGRQFDTRG
jgi:hypothetical protein